MSTTDETAFRHAVRAALRHLSTQVDALETDALDSRTSDGVLQVDFEGGGTFVVSQQVPVRELWLSAFSRAWHFRVVGGAWKERDTGEALESVLSDCFTRKLGDTVTIQALPVP